MYFIINLTNYCMCVYIPSSFKLDEEMGDFSFSWINFDDRMEGQLSAFVGFLYGDFTFSAYFATISCASWRSCWKENHDCDIVHIQFVGLLLQWYLNGILNPFRAIARKSNRKVIIKNEIISFLDRKCHYKLNFITFFILMWARI